MPLGSPHLAELTVMRSILQSLLPSVMPKIEGFLTAGWNQPADQTRGNDYDGQALPNGTVVRELTDVTGHGIASALLATVCRALCASPFQPGRGLLKARERLNAELPGDMGEKRFCNIGGGCLRAASRVELLSAGHGPLFV